RAALIAAKALRIRLRQIPRGGAAAGERPRARDVGAPHLVERLRGPVDDDQMTVAVAHALVAGLALEGAAGRHGEGHVVAIRRIEVGRRREGAEGRRRVGLEHLDAEVDPHRAEAPATGGAERLDDAVGGRALRERGDVGVPGVRGLEELAAAERRRGRDARGRGGRRRQGRGRGGEGRGRARRRARRRGAGGRLRRRGGAGRGGGRRGRRGGRRGLRGGGRARRGRGGGGRGR